MAITKLQSSRDFFRIWFFWQKQACFVFLIIVGFVMFYAYSATAKYESKAKILLLPKTSQDLIITAGEDQRQVIQKVTSEDLNTEMDLFQSDNVIHNTIKSFPNNEIGLKIKERGLFDKIIYFLNTNINKVLTLLGLKEDNFSEFESKANQLKNSIDISIYESNIMEVTLRAEEPEQAAVILEKLLRNYIKHHDQVFSIDEGLRFYDDQTEIFKTRLEAAEFALKNYQKNSDIVDFTEQNNANILLFTELKKELQYLEIAYDESKSRLEIFEEGLLYSGEVLITKEMRTIPSIIELEKSVVPLLLQRSALSKTFTPTSREYKDINTQIEMIRGEIRNEIRKAFETERLELKSKKVKKESLKKKIKEIYMEASLLKEKESVLKDLIRQADMHKINYKLYASKTENSRVYSEKKKQNLSNVTIADYPSISKNPVAPKKLLLLFLSTFFGLIAAIIVPFILESLDQKLKTIDDVEKILSLPVISSFPEVK